MSSVDGKARSEGSFNRGSARLEDPFSSPNLHVDDACSTISAPSLGRKTASGLDTPTRTSKPVTNTPSTRGHSKSKDNSSPASAPPSTQTPRSDVVPELSSPGDTDSAGSFSIHSPLREDRVGKEITDENAQGYYGPGHSVFFGNLPMNMSNNLLQQVIKKDLEDRVGKCYVTIARDGRNIPIAFAIFASEADARKALAVGSQCIIGRRALRPEAPKGNFVFIVFKNDGDEVTNSEVNSLFRDKGPILQIFTPDATMRGYFDLPKNSKCVQMGTFGDFRDARKSLHRTAEGINIMPLAKLGHSRLSSRPGLSPRTQMVDCLSIYVGNLPSRCFKDELIQMFQSVGTVKNVQLVRNARAPGPGFHTPGSGFAFIEFVEPYAVFEAICVFNNYVFRGQVLRVEFRMQTKMAMQQLQREVNGYVAQCHAQCGFHPPPDLLMAFLGARSAPSPSASYPLMRAAPQDPVSYYVASLLALQPSM